MVQLNLTLFGGFQARLDSGAPISLPTKKAQALLAYLALHPGQSHPRDKLATLFWGETGEEQARHSLRQTLVGLRKALSHSSVPSLLRDGEELSLDPAAVEVDVMTFRRLVSEGTADSLSRAADLYRGDLLEGLHVKEESFEEWLLSEREMLWELALEALARLLKHQIGAEAREAAVQTALRLLALDPLQEAVHRALMRLYAQMGRRNAAIKQYQTCTTALQRELGVDPQPETRQLYDQVVQQEPAASWRSETITPLRRPNETSSILVVEDEPVTRTLLEGFLKNEAFMVVVAEDGAEALLQLGKRRFDLVVSDINMPNLGGFKLLEIMSQKGIETPAIFVTALLDEELEVRGFELGAADFIRKPIRREILLLRVRNILRQTRRKFAEA